MTWEVFERATKFLGAMIWGTWEVMVRDDPSTDRLVFIATVLAGSEGIRAVVRMRKVGES